MIDSGIDNGSEEYFSDKADLLANAVLNGVDIGAQARHVWQVTGEATAGKTKVLERVRDRLIDEGLEPILVAPPSGADDAGMVALTHIALGLLRWDHLDATQFHQLLKPDVYWDLKVARVADALEEAKKDIVLLCEEPHGWMSNDNSDYFTKRTEQVTHELVFNGTGCRVVISGHVPNYTGGVQVIEGVPVEPGTSLDKRLAETRLQPFRREAHFLVDSSAEALQRLSAVELRLLLAYAHVGSMDAARDWLLRPTGRLPLLLMRALASTPERRHLLRVWRILAHARVPFDRRLFSEAGVDGLDADSRAVLSLMLVTREDPTGTQADQWFVHNSLRNYARRRFGDSDELPNDAHTRLARFYLESLDCAPAGANVAEEEASKLNVMEAFFHSLLAEEPVDGLDVLQDRAFFADQLNMLGYVLSVRHRRRAEAARVFRRSLEYARNAASKGDLEGKQPAVVADLIAYPAHYLAYNLDLLGRDAPEVEKLYEESLAKNSKTDLWHTHYICFLLTVGKLDQARAAWDEALLQVGGPNAEVRPGVYRTLHLRVIKACLDSSYLDLAREIADDVPGHVLSQADFQEVLFELRTRIAAARFGSVVPDEVLAADFWWRRDPPTLPTSVGDKHLTRWITGRIAHEDEDCVALQAAEIVRGDPDEPEKKLVRVPRDVFAEWWAGDEEVPLPEFGAFVEIGFYGHRDDVVVRMNYRKPTSAEAFTTDSDPDRFLREAGWISPNSGTP